MKQNTLQNAKILYAYLNVFTKVRKADLIIGLGCMDKSIPLECSRLYKEGFADKIVFTGNSGKGTKGSLNITEAKRFKNIATENGVPEDKIILEEQATNTYENYKFTKLLLNEMKINYESVIIVQKPYVKRRCTAIADVEMKDKKIYVTSKNLSFEEFTNQSLKNGTMTLDDIINEITGEVSIIISTPKYNLQSPQPINEAVLNAYKQLLNEGYDKYIITQEEIEIILKRLGTLGIL